MEKSPEPARDLLLDLQQSARSLIQHKLNGIVDRLVNQEPGETPEHYFRRISKIISNPALNKKVESALLSGQRAPISATSRRRMSRSQKAAQALRRENEKAKAKEQEKGRKSKTAA